LDIYSSDLSELIRKGYDLVYEPEFPEICRLLNDSILSKAPIEIQIIPNIYPNFKAIDWTISYNDINHIALVSDRLFLNINLIKGGIIEIQDESEPVSIQDMKEIARQYIYYPDSSARRVTHYKKKIEHLGEFETTNACSTLHLDIKKNNRLSIDDWSFFYKCINALIDLSNEERDLLSKKIWNENYVNLSYDQKEDIIDIINYNIMIRFR